jgi:peptidoglycan/LPS O-acetylase OafA/YrhL
MKKSFLTVVVTGLVLVTTVLWMSGALSVSLGEYIQFVIIGILVCFGLYVGYRRFTSEKRGQPAEDEFSKKILQKSAAISYYISLYLWLVIMYLTDRLKIETDIMFGWGILGMAVIFAGSWIYFNLRGMKDA